uniref:Uncharacterized protein n=1 Tax=Anopheles atroparvus TaxID=41427 RepID=A0A182JBF9_ANOAO
MLDRCNPRTVYRSIGFAFSSNSAQTSGGGIFGIWKIFSIPSRQPTATMYSTVDIMRTQVSSWEPPSVASRSIAPLFRLYQNTSPTFVPMAMNSGTRSMQITGKVRVVAQDVSMHTKRNLVDCRGVVWGFNGPEYDELVSIVFRLDGLEGLQSLADKVGRSRWLEQ